SAESAAARSFDGDRVARRNLGFIATLERNLCAVFARDPVCAARAGFAAFQSERIGFAARRKNAGRHSFAELDAADHAVATRVRATAARTAADGEFFDDHGIARLQN